jgi:signal transduction histidine kinase
MDGEIFQDASSLDHQVEPDEMPASGRAARGAPRRSGPRPPSSRPVAEPKTGRLEPARGSRLAALGQMASRVARDLRDNLAPVTLYLRLLRRRLSDDSGSIDVLDKIEPAILAIDATVNDLLNFTSDRDPNLQWVNLRALIDDVCESLSPRLAANDIETVTDVPRQLGVLADRNMLRSAILNLALNALDVMPDGGRLVVTSYTGRGGVELEIADSGPGLSEEARRRLFEPFFTTKSGGAGLGLAVVHRIAEAHGGDVVAANCPEGGAAFTLRFPQRAQQAAA